MSLEPSCQSVEDLYEKTSDDRAIRNRRMVELKEDYPMLCFCHPGRPEGLCGARPDGHRGRVPLRRKLLWAWPAFGWYALKYMKVGYMHKFYVDDYPQASLGIMAFSAVLSVLVDAFTDPKMAVWTDTLRSKYGRRRPFIFASAFFVPCVFILAWTPALVSPGVGASLWYGFFHICYKLADTVFLIPHDAWGAQLTPVYKEKTAVWQAREICMSVGILCGMAVMPLIFVTEQCSSSPDDGCYQLPLLSAFFGVIFLEACLQLVFFGKEPASESDAPKPPGPFKTCCSWRRFSEEDTIPTLMSTFLNRPFRILLSVDIVKAIGEEVPFTVLPFLASWVLGEKCFEGSFLFGILVVCGLGSGLISVPLWTYMSSRLSKYRAYFIYNTVGMVACLSLVFIGFDDGSCGFSYGALVLVGFFGLAGGGKFLLYDIISDVVDYDELLTRGRRREASYLMAVEFVPKFMSLPGECIPFLLLAYFNYQRPLDQRRRLPCGAEVLTNGLSPDAVCQAFYANETAGGPPLCSDAVSCSDMFAMGVSFVCNNALGECGIRQSEAVRWVLRVCGAIFPGVVIMFGLVALSRYPRAARGEAVHERLLLAISGLRRGETVEDPWRPGYYIHPDAPRVEPSSKDVHGALSYFTPSELKAVLDETPNEAAVTSVSRLVRRSTGWLICFTLCLPVGGYIVHLGLPDMSNDLGASVSPLGLMLVGIALFGVWFQGARLMASLELRRQRVKRHDIVVRFNQMCPFIGAKPLPLPLSESE